MKRRVSKKNCIMKMGADFWQVAQENCGDYERSSLIALDRACSVFCRPRVVSDAKRWRRWRGVRGWGLGSGDVTRKICEVFSWFRGGEGRRVADESQMQHSVQIRNYRKVICQKKLILTVGPIKYLWNN